MRRKIAGFGLLGLLTTAACHKAVPVAAKAPEAPVVASVPASTPPQTDAVRPAPPVQPAPQAPQSNTMTPEERATLNESLARLEDALFDYDQSTIRADAAVALKDNVAVIRDILANYPNQKLQIEGHADDRGSEEYNVALGDKRARAAEEFLTTMGVSQSQLTIVSYGKDRPVCTEESEACWQKNRRAHVTARP